MGCCRSSRDEQGYATPAALVVCLSLALVASAMIVRSTAALRLARSDLEMTQTSYALDGAHLAAAAAVVRTAQKGPYHWTFTTDLGWVEAWAEPERDKLGLSNAADLNDEVFMAFGVTDVAAIRQRLRAAASSLGTLPPDIAAMDEAMTWRRCAPSLISLYGEAEALAAATHVVPKAGPGPEPQSWRIGEPWRIAVTTAAGWRDERVVRFTGDASQPVAVVVRRLKHESGSGGQCETVMQGKAQP